MKDSLTSDEDLDEISLAEVLEAPKVKMTPNPVQMLDYSALPNKLETHHLQKRNARA